MAGKAQGGAARHRQANTRCATAARAAPRPAAALLHAACCLRRAASHTHAACATCAAAPADIQFEEKKVRKSITEAAKRGDISTCKVWGGPAICCDLS